MKENEEDIFRQNCSEWNKEKKKEIQKKAIIKEAKGGKI